MLAVQEDGTDAERELWRQTRKYISGTTAPFHASMPAETQSLTVCLN